MLNKQRIMGYSSAVSISKEQAIQKENILRLGIIHK